MRGKRRLAPAASWERAYLLVSMLEQEPAELQRLHQLLLHQLVIGLLDVPKSLERKKGGYIYGSEPTTAWRLSELSVWLTGQKPNSFCW